MDWLRTCLGWIKLKPRYLLGLAITCLTVVGLPKAWRQYLGYDGIINPYRGWISLVGLASGVYGLIVFMAGIPAWVFEKWKGWRFRQRAPTIVRKLSSQEKGYIANYIEKNASSLKFNIGDGVINGLVGKKVVYIGSSFSVDRGNLPFNLQPWVLEAFDKYPDLRDEILKYLVKEPK
jgi:hypothetical protein